MKKIGLFLGACVVFSNSLSAALPPLYQEINEIKAILDDEKLSHYLSSGDLILSINRVEKGYVILTNHDQKLVAEVVYDQNRKIGPAQFQIVFHSLSVEK